MKQLRRTFGYFNREPDILDLGKTVIVSQRVRAEDMMKQILAAFSKRLATLGVDHPTLRPGNGHTAHLGGIQELDK